MSLGSLFSARRIKGLKGSVLNFTIRNSVSGFVIWHTSSFKGAIFSHFGEYFSLLTSSEIKLCLGKQLRKSFKNQTRLSKMLSLKNTTGKTQRLKIWRQRYLLKPRQKKKSSKWEFVLKKCRNLSDR